MLTPEKHNRKSARNKKSAQNRLSRSPCRSNRLLRPDVFLVLRQSSLLLHAADAQLRFERGDLVAVSDRKSRAITRHPSRAHLRICTFCFSATSSACASCVFFKPLSISYLQRKQREQQRTPTLTSNTKKSGAEIRALTFSAAPRTPPPSSSCWPPLRLRLSWTTAKSYNRHPVDNS